MGDSCPVGLGVSVKFWAAGVRKDRSVFLAVSLYDSVTVLSGFPHLGMFFIAIV